MLLQTALALAKKNLAVFPCQPGGKLPATEHGFRDATTDTNTIVRWWHSEPQYNVAIATGEVSGVFVVDIDGVDAELELRRLEKEFGKLPPSVEVITPRPGRHIYFKMPDKPVRNSAGRIGPGIDTRATGGYVIVPPSVGPSGRAYAWSVDSGTVFAAAPAWLLHRITNGSTDGARPASEWRALVAAGVNEGARDSTCTKLAGHLLRRFIDPHVVLDLMQCWNATRCRPPLAEADIVRIVESICDAELRRRGNAR
jgi:hypothetical protein